MWKALRGFKGFLKVGEYLDPFFSDDFSTKGRT